MLLHYILYLVVVLLCCVESVALMFDTDGSHILSFWCISQNCYVGYVVALTFYNSVNINLMLSIYQYYLYHW